MADIDDTGGEAFVTVLPEHKEKFKEVQPLSHMVMRIVLSGLLFEDHHFLKDKSAHI